MLSYDLYWMQAPFTLQILCHNFVKATIKEKILLAEIHNYTTYITGTSPFFSRLKYISAPNHVVQPRHFPNEILHRMLCNMERKAVGTPVTLEKCCISHICHFYILYDRISPLQSSLLSLSSTVMLGWAENCITNHSKFRYHKKKWEVLSRPHW